MNFFETYTYVDAFYEHAKTRKRLPWKRMQARDVEAQIVEAASRSNCFHTVQRFKEATRLGAKRDESSGDDGEADNFPDQQLHYCGPFFDFDCKAEANGITEEEALGRSRADAIKVAEFFLKSFDLNEAHVQAWFSGRKGFHVLVRPEVFAIGPHRHLTYIIQKVALELIHQLELTTLDKAVYTVGRMWRIPNTVHHSTGRFKIELTFKELRDLPLKEVLERSRVPRKGGALVDQNGNPLSAVWAPEDYENIAASKEAIGWWAHFVDLYEAVKEAKNLRPKNPIRRPLDPAIRDKNPACVNDLLENGPKRGGNTRNRAVLSLATFFKDAGIDRMDAHKIIREWTSANYPEGNELRERLLNGRSVVDSVYRSDTYHFSCRAMRNNSGPGVEGKIQCDTEAKCAWLQSPPDQDPVQTPNVPLYEATRGCYIDTVVRIPVHVSALSDKVYGVETKGTVTCTPVPKEKGSLCVGCPCASQGGGMWSFKYTDQMLLELIDVNRNRKKGTLKQKIQIPANCTRFSTTPTEKSNIEEISIIPMVDYSQAYMDDVSGNTEADVARKRSRHVVRRGFYLGHGIQTNKKYIIDAFVTLHPEDQTVVFIFDKAEPAQTDVDQFSMTPELSQELKIFRPKEGQSVESKFKEIHDDFEANVHRIGGRQDLSIAIDLSYHSVIGYKIGSDVEERGWFEVLVMGDSGTGKSTMTKKLMVHFGLGEMASGEESKRTGLVYASTQMGHGQWVIQWGKIPQNDRRLVIIDEFAAIPVEELSKLTQLRSTGHAEGGGVNQHQVTFARTRMIYLTNPRDGRSLADYNFGVEAVNQVFGEDQDRRRLDLAIVVKSDEVPRSILNKDWGDVKVEHRYTSDLCRNLILWAWSLDPKQVEWTDDAYAAIRSHATIMADTYLCDIPFANPSDLRNKIARISAAVAARMFSSDEEAKKLIVKKEHVDFAAKFMDKSYRKPSMDFFGYAKNYQMDNTITRERQEIITKKLRSFPNADNTISRLAHATYFGRTELGEMTGYEKEELADFWKFLLSQSLIRRTSRSYKKVSAFNELLKRLNKERSQGRSEEVVQANLPGTEESGGDDEPPF
jgi:hypothetical protein